MTQIKGAKPDINVTPLIDVLLVLLSYVDQNEYLRVFVGQLRKKVEPEGSKPRYILTEPWVGYRFEPGSPHE